MGFDSLTPKIILDCFFKQGQRPTGALIPLNSYENRVYEVPVEDGPSLIAKFYRQNRWSSQTIADEHRFASQLVEAEIPVLAPLALPKPAPEAISLGYDHDFHYAFFPKLKGREKPEMDASETRQIGRLMGRLHNMGEKNIMPHRPKLDFESFVYSPTQILLQNNYIPEQLQSSFGSFLNGFMPLLKTFFDRPVKIISLHGDCHIGNILWNKDGPHLVDFDDMIVGPPVQDLWMLFSGSKEEMQTQVDNFLEGYEVFRSFDRSTLGLIEPLRSARMIRHAAWIGQRFGEEAFKKAFPYYDQNRYWESLFLNLKEQTSIIQEQRELI